jgi:hypothetical protein
MLRFPAFLSVCLTVLGLSHLCAQNTGTVFSPDVKAATQAVEVRFAYDPNGESLAKRAHYQYAFNDAFRMRGIVTFRSDDVENWDYRYVRLEGQYQFLEDEDAMIDSAVRVELQYADGDDPASRVRLGWTNKIDLNEDWQVRGILLTGHQFGPESSGGYLLETRGQISRALNDSLTLALDYFGDFNDTNDIGSFDEQEHQLGPTLKFDLSDRLGGMAGALFGLSDSTSDVEYRIFLTYAL